jgi:ABC-type phosphate transport system substrate-binding protein
MSTQTRSAGRTRRLAAATVALGLLVGLAACGGDEDPSPRDARDEQSINRADVEPTGSATAGTADGTGGSPGTEGEEAAARLGDRPEATPGVVEVDGSADTLTTPARAAYARTLPSTTVTQDTSGDSRGFERLCIGDIDIVDSSRPITAEEYEACRLNGLDVVQFQVAADAVVLAIRSQTDVGSDCLSTDQVRASFRAGSTITNWSQLGDNFDDVKLEAGGPTVEDPVARYFGRYVLDNPEPVNSDFRVDYVGTRDEDRTRLFVTGFDNDRRQVGDLRYVQPVYDKYKAELKTKWADWARANREVKLAVAAQRQGIRDRWSPAERAASDRRVTRAYEWRGREITYVNSLKAKLEPYEERYHELVKIQKRINDQFGHVGMFSHGYYATYEDRLRPFEIEVYDGDDQPNCIFPSPQTILDGEYPLSRQLLLTVTTRSIQRPEVRDFLEDYLTRSQALATENGVVAISDRDLARQLGWLAEDGEVPRFGVVDGEFREITPEDESPLEDQPAPPVENPAR